MTAIWWIRRDLRLADNPALNAAAACGRVLPLFVHDPALAGASHRRRARVEGSLRSLDQATYGVVVKRSGDPRAILVEVAQEIGAASVHVTGEYTPFAIQRDRAVAEQLESAGVKMYASGSPYAVIPGSVVTGVGTPFRVFGAYAKAWRERQVELPYAVPTGLEWLPGIAGEPFADDLLAAVDPLGPVGEEAALARWREFLNDELDTYDLARDRPDLNRTSRISVHLRHGEIHPRRLLHDIAEHGFTPGANSYVDELIWREFYADVLWNRPDSSWHDLRELAIDYDEGEHVDRLLDAWRQGRTGFPFVDAGMRQLLLTGWMHNRLRMVAASFLVKDLHVRWQHGARHFLSQLLDGDVASNNHGWQWVAGTGTDAAPYFRIFNPVTQGLRFDPDGTYVRRWVPELAHLPGAQAHEPWRHADGYRHGYVPRIVDHAEERRESLARYRYARGR